MKSLKVLFVLLVAGTGWVRPAAADEVCRPCPFDCAGIGASRRDCRDLPGSYNQCCVSLDGRGMDQLRERDLENQRRGRYGYDDQSRRRDPGAYDDQAGFNPGDCPRGFHVNERNCTSEERARGCQDMRSPSGQICVGWNRR